MKNLNDRHFRKENSIFGFENCNKFSENFGKCNALGPFIPLEEYVYKFSAQFLKNSSKMRLPQKNYFTQRVSLPKKVLPRKMGLPRKLCLHQKKVSLPKNVYLPKKFFPLKI